MKHDDVFISIDNIYRPEVRAAGVGVITPPFRRCACDDGGTRCEGVALFEHVICTQCQSGVHKHVISESGG